MTAAGATTPIDRAAFGLASLGALGVVFGDIGTSPLYTLKTVIALSGGKATPAVVLGSLSLIVWTLTVVTTLKYVTVAMRIDNDGEGGILALMSLLGVKRGHRPWIVASGLFGAALIYGDGAITPAISVLSALEGLELVAPLFKPYILPMAVVVLAGLFLIQPFGTAFIGRAFGPVMLLWFATISILGLAGIRHDPSVLLAINPLYAVNFLATNGMTGFLVLGGVFLCVTGAEALYADMGHFGAQPIRFTWLAIVFPSLVLSYAGQGAFVLSHGASDDNAFYRLAPDALLIPLVILATVATVIASQAIITGAFSMTRQAIRLGWMPRLHITQTSQDNYGQIYVGAVNWLLMVITIGLALAFGKSDGLASAYGIAVSATMLMTTVLLYIAMREIWRWGDAKAGLVAGAFFVVDAAFLVANMSKIGQGGYVPIVLAALVYAVMYVWHRGQSAIRERSAEMPVPLDRFLAGLEASGVTRVGGTAIFLTREQHQTPPLIAWYVEHTHALQRRVVAVTIDTESKPWVDSGTRATVTQAAPDFWRVCARYGFLERPDVTRLLESLAHHGCAIDLADATCYVGLETAVPREDGQGLPRWFVMMFARLTRNAVHVQDALNFPRDRVVEIGRRIPI